MSSDYRNYKGWTSILAVAFTDSFYRFFEIDVGYPGRAGDNTVLKHSWLMQKFREDPDTWLGPGGLVLGDSGASDGDNVCSSTPTTICGLLSPLSRHPYELPSTRIDCTGVARRLCTLSQVMNQLSSTKNRVAKA